MSSFQLSLAPQKLWQAINPWTFRQNQFGFINIDLGHTDHPEIEQAVLDKVGSYGKQLGHLGDVVEILLRHVDLGKLTPGERDAIKIFDGELAQIRQIKRSKGR